MQKISRLLKIITAAATLLLVIYLGWSCIDVYLVGNSASNIADGGVHIAPVFTREIAAERLSPLLPWVLAMPCWSPSRLLYSRRLLRIKNALMQQSSRSIKKLRS